MGVVDLMVVLVLAGFGGAAYGCRWRLLCCGYFGLGFAGISVVLRLG